MSSFVTIKKPYKQKSLIVNGLNTKVYSLRLRSDEFELIERICNKLDTKLSTFIKYCAIEVAKEIDKESNNAI